MQLIEPCCSQKHVAQLIDSLGDNGTGLFHGYGDLSLSELFPSVIFRYSETDVLLACPWVPDSLAEVIEYWMRKTWARVNGRGNMDVISRMTVVANLSERKSPEASQWLARNPFPERLTLLSVQQADTAIVMPDLALFGPVNVAYGNHFTATATKNQELIAELRKTYASLH